MPEAMYTLRDLLIHELSDLYSAEDQIIEALPGMIHAASSAKLRTAFEDHLRVTQQQRNRLDEVFNFLGDRPSGEACVAMKGIIAEGQKLIKMQNMTDPAVLDAALIAAAQRVEHYEIAGYGCARTYAQHLGLDQAVTLLQQTLDEEGATDHLLTELAVSEINVRAQGQLYGSAGA
jgi:ferritin-like metal-binding protein YciE